MDLLLACSPFTGALSEQVYEMSQSAELIHGYTSSTLYYVV